MTDHDRARARRDELIAANVAGELTPEEAAELDALRREDPTVELEIAELTEIALALGDLGEWDPAEPSPDLERRIAAALASEQEDSAARDGARADPAVTRSTARSESAPVAVGTAPGTASALTPAAPPVDLSSRRRPAVLVLAAAACVALGAGLGLVVPAALDAPPSGPPGTLGATETVDFTGEPSGARVDGELVAHTWGTETLLEIDGVEVGDDYRVVVIDLAGEEHDSGTFIGSTATVVCRMNAAVLREEVAAVEIRDSAGAPVAVAEVPPASAEPSDS